MSAIRDRCDPSCQTCPLVSIRGRSAITRLAAGSSTNLAGGLVAGARLIAESRDRLPATLRPRLVLLTDGCANHGVATSAAELVELARAELRSASGTALSAFGYGDDCDHPLLDALTDEGGGSFAFIASEDAVLTAFARELGGLVSTYAEDVRVRVVPQAGAVIVDNVGALLFHGEARRVHRIAVAAHGRASGVEIGAVEVTWRGGRAQEHTARVPVLVDHVAPGAEDTVDDSAVARSRDEEELRRAQEVADRAARQGDYVGARRRLEAAAARLRDPGLIAFLRDVLLPCYAGGGEYGASSGLRTSTSAALKGKRMSSTHQRVEGVFDVGPTAAQEAVEKSFRKKSGKNKIPH